MKMGWRRFEVLFPLQFNDERPVPKAWIGEAMVEIGIHFGAASFETQKIKGMWRHGAEFYRDDLVRLVVDLPGSNKNRRWMKDFKARWKAKLEQLELWMVSYRIDIE